MDYELLERLQHVERRQAQIEAKLDYLVDAICQRTMEEPPPPMVLTQEEGKMMLRFSKAHGPKGIED